MTDVEPAIEEQVLGSMMASPAAAAECAGILKPNDFSTETNAAVFAAIVRQLNEGQPTDMIAIMDRLVYSGDVTMESATSTLYAMTAAVTTPANAGYYAMKVKETAKKNRVHKVAVQMAARASDVTEADTAETIAQQARELLDSVLDDIAVEVKPVGWDFDDLVASLQEAPTYVSTPWQDLNPLIDGWRPGALYIAAARPGEGKSILGLQAAAGLAQYGQPVAFSSLEMSQAEIFNRLIAARAGIPLNAINRRQLDDRQLGLIYQMRSEIQGLPIYIDDRAGVTIDDIRAHVRAVARNGKPAGLVVDYLQLVVSAQSSKQRWEAVGDISRALKQIAREYEMPVIALAQLNRAGADGKPSLQHLRESGSLEQDADVVLLQARERDPDTQEFGDYLDLWVAKNRHGQTGHIRLFWEGHFARFTDLSIYE